MDCQWCLGRSIPFYQFGRSTPFIALKGCGLTKMIKGYGSIKTSLTVHAVYPMPKIMLFKLLNKTSICVGGLSRNIHFQSDLPWYQCFSYFIYFSRRSWNTERKCLDIQQGGNHDYLNHFRNETDVVHLLILSWRKKNSTGLYTVQILMHFD